MPHPAAACAVLHEGRCEACCASLLWHGAAVHRVRLTGGKRVAQASHSVLMVACALQGVADELAVDAYETHARVALESDDPPEFRQCLARLKQLYRAGVSAAAAAGTHAHTPGISRLPQRSSCSISACP